MLDKVIVTMIKQSKNNTTLVTKSESLSTEKKKIRTLQTMIIPKHSVHFTSYELLHLYQLKLYSLFLAF